jgi:hypothetical protein
MVVRRVIAGYVSVAGAVDALHDLVLANGRFYGTCVIDGLTEPSPAEYARRLPVLAEWPPDEATIRRRDCLTSSGLEVSP